MWITMTGKRGVAILTVAIAACSVPNDPSTCVDVAMCDLRPGGNCVRAPSGTSWCTYSDPLCPSSARWSPQAGDGLAGTCVDGDAGPLDTTNPSFATFDGPLEGGTSRRTVTFTYTASDDSGRPPTLTCSLDGTMLTGGCSSPSVLQGLAFGKHTFVVTATDSAGNSQSITRHWTVTPLSSGQSAELAVGQPDLVTTLAYEVDAKHVYPWGIAWDQQLLWVADGDPHGGRVMAWSPAPSASFDDAILVFGQPDLGSSSWIGPSDRAFGPINVHHVSAIIGVVAVTDLNRVLVFRYDNFDTLNGKPATVVLGQTDFVSTQSGSDGSRLNGPDSVWTDGQRLVVSDSGNHRVLIWNSIPSQNGAGADLVLGAPDVDSIGNSDTIDASSMGLPRGVVFDGERLYVVDSYHSRVLIWSQFPTVNNAPADIVVGQIDLTTYEHPIAPTDRHFNSPQGIAVGADNLFVCDAQRSRVMVFSPSPRENGAAASVVLGQDDFASGDSPSGIDGKHFRCGDMAIGASRLYVTDSARYRVLGFKLELF